MKTISKRFLKGALAMLLAVVMLFGTTITGFAAVVDNADTSANVDVAETSATITSDGTARLYFNMKAVSWWTAGTNGNGNFAYFFNNSTNKNAWSAHAVKYSGDTYYVVIPSGSWAGVILTRNNTSTSPSWDNKWNQTGDITLSSSSNYLSKFSEGSTSVTWGSAVKLTSTASLAASSSSVEVGTAVTLTPNLTSNANLNTIKSTTYSVSPSGASVSGNTFTATAAGTYTVTATVTYHPNGYSSITSTATASTTITVTDPGYSYTVTAGDGGTVSPESGTATSVEITATPADGYEFTGWEVTGDGSVVDPSAVSTTLTINADGVVAHATFAKKTYTVKFTDINGNQIGSPQTVEHGATPTAPTAPAITGKTFAGWSPAVGAVTDDTTYQATYTDNTYSITVNQTGGTGTVNLGKTSAKYGDTVTLSVTPPDNHKISSITGGGLNIGECDSYNGSFEMPASNVTLTINYVQAGSCGLNFALGDQSLVLGATVSNEATANSFCSGGTISYKSSDETVATVDASTGLVTAKKPGTTTITATCSTDKTTATYNVTVKTPSVSVPALTVAVNGTATAAPVITDGPASGYTLTYSSTAADFTVTADGIVTGIKPGSGTVNYTMTYGVNEVATGSFDVTVSTPAFSIRPLTDNLIVGQTMTADFETTSTPAAQSVTLTSADTSKVTISGKKATAVAAAPEGVTITATFKYNDSYSATATAKVIVAEPEITADPTSVALEFGEGATATSKTVELDTNAAAGNGTGDDVTVTSANTNVATATLSGSTITINATGVGSTTVTAKFHDAEVEIPVTVTQYDPYVYLYVTDSQDWGNMFLHSWKGSNSNVTTLGQSNAQMIYIGRNGDDDKIFAYRFLKGSEPEKVIMVKTNSWPSDNLTRTDDYAVDFSKGYAALYIDSSTNSSGRRNTGDWTDDCMIVRPTVSVADVVVPVGGTETATATVTNGDVVYWTMADTNTATVADVETQTSTVTGVAPGETTISARAFVDTANSSIKTLPTNYKTDSTSWPFISTEATATVTVGSVDYDITVAASYSDNGTDYTDDTVGGTAIITVDGVDNGTSASVAHGDSYTLTANANDNYRFVGWYNGDTQVSTEASYTVVAKAAADYTARFVKTHKVTVNFNEGIDSVTLNGIEYTGSFDNITVDAGATVTVKATAAADYEFSHWDLVYGDLTDVVDAVEYTIENVQNSITLTANAVPVYTASATAQTNKYFGTYGGTVTINGQSSPVQCEVGDTVTFEAHNNTNYYFDGWYTDAEFTNKVSADTEYQTEMTADGITLYGLFVKQFYLTSSADVRLAEFEYNVADNSYSVTTDFTDHFTLTSNDNNDVTAIDVNVTGGTHTGCTVVGHYTSYQITPDTENYDIESPVTYTLTPDMNNEGSADGTYTLNIALSDAEKVEISVNGTKVADKAIGSTFSYEIEAPEGQYLSGATTNPAVEFEIVDGEIVFEVPEQNVNIVPQFANYSYVELTDSTGITATGLKTGYKAGEAVSITLSPASEATTITNVVADYDGAVITQNGDNWTVTIDSMPADTTVTLTTSVDAKFVMSYGSKAIGNYGSGYTTYGTVSMAIGDTALAKDGYAAPTDTVTYTATPNANFIFDGWYSDANCSKGNVLSRETSYDVTPTADTTIYALFVPKHYIAEDQAKVDTHSEMTYDPATRSFRYSSSTLAKGAWFRVSNNPTTSYWTDSTSYCIFDSSFNVTFNDNAYLVTVGWGTQCYALTSDSTAEYPFEVIVTIDENSSIDVSCQAAKTGAGTVFLSSGRLDLPGSYNATVFEATSSFTNTDITNPADVYVANEGENREKYKKLNLAEPKTLTFETEITGTAAANYEVDSYVVYHIDTERYEVVTPNVLGNNKYSGSVYAEGSCYIVPIYFLTEAYANDNNLAEIDIYFDATAIKDNAWGPFVACYAWGSNGAEYQGGWSGQMMIPTTDGKSFYTMITVPKADDEKAPSIPNGVTFNNYTQSTVPGSNPGAFGISATQYQCYDYREPITLYEVGYNVITFVAKDSTDGYHGDRANGVTANTVTSSTTNIFDTYEFDYLYSRDGVTPMDFNGDEIENHVDLSTGAKADYYVITKGDITYDPNGTKYVGDNAFDADWAVDWYIFDSTGKYLTNILSTAMWHDKDDDLETLYTYLHEALGVTAADVAGKTVAISYEHENNAGHQVSYDGQWYGNYLEDKVTGQVIVGLENADGTYTFETDDTLNEADYGQGYLKDSEGGLHQSLEITLDYGIADLTASPNDNYRFIGWYTKDANGNLVLEKNTLNCSTYINFDETYYAIFKEIGEGEVVINHTKYVNDDPAIPSHDGVGEYTVIVKDATGTPIASGTPSTGTSTVVFDARDTETYTIEIITTPLLNGKFYAWYTDSYNADGSKTFEEVFTDDSVVDQTSTVSTSFEYYYDSEDPNLQTKINIYSDIKRVTNTATIYYKYYNRFGVERTYTVKDVPLTDLECTGFLGNKGIAYAPSFVTAYTFLDSNGDEVVVYGDDRYNEYIKNGYTYLGSYNKVQYYAPKAEVTEVYNGTVSWEITGDAKLAPEASYVTFWANQDDVTFTLNYTMPDVDDGLAEKTFTTSGSYDTLLEITAPTKNKDGDVFSYWYDETNDEILTYTRTYNYRLTDSRDIKAYYGVEDLADWTPTIETVTYTREFADGGDYIYTDYHLAYTSREGKELNKVYASENIEYGLLVFRDADYYITPDAVVEYPDASNPTTQDFLERVAGEKRKNMAFTVEGNKYNCYYYDLTGKELTNFNRCDYYLKYNNNKYVSSTDERYFRECAFTAVAFIAIDTDGDDIAETVYLSNPEHVNFYDLGNLDYDNIEDN